MTKEEFETLAGCRVSQEVYVDIETLYIAAGDVTKAEFCNFVCRHFYETEKSWKVLSNVLHGIATHIRTADEKLRTFAKRDFSAGNERYNMLKFMLECHDSPSTILAYSEEKLGPLDSAIIKIGEGMPLNKNEKETALRILANVNEGEKENN